MSPLVDLHYERLAIDLDGVHLGLARLARRQLAAGGCRLNAEGLPRFSRNLRPICGNNA